MFVATHWPDIDRFKPDTGWPIPFFEVVMHAGVYAGWVVMWWWVLRTHGRQLSGAATTWIMAGGAAYGAFDELTQALVNREPTMPDFTCNVVGILIAIVILQAVDRWVLKQPAT
jgi:hypothetical protein